MAQFVPRYIPFAEHFQPCSPDAYRHSLLLIRRLSSLHPPGRGTPICIWLVSSSDYRRRARPACSPAQQREDTTFMASGGVAETSIGSRWSRDRCLPKAGSLSCTIYGNSVVRSISSSSVDRTSVDRTELPRQLVARAKGALKSRALGSEG